MKHFYRHELSHDIQIDDLSTETINDLRYYVTPTGKKYPSVTSVLGHDPKKKDMLDKWRKRIGEEQSASITKYAGDVGTELHGTIEKYLYNDPDYLKDISIHAKYMFYGIQKHLDRIDNIIIQEAALYSDTLQIAGRTDTIAEWDGELAIIDYKTSKKEKKEEWIENYYLQGTCYSLMFEEMTGIKIPKIVICMIQYNSTPLIFETTRKQHFKKLKEVLNTNIPKLIL
jgi:hypothetical protein